MICLIIARIILNYRNPYIVMILDQRLTYLLITERQNKIMVNFH